ncbi:MAG: hypothetical protein R2753_05615 [Chitinophagales bacterium]
MHLEFEKEYDALYKSLNGFNPEDEDWFLPELLKLINKYGANTACEFAKNNASAIYVTELLIKAGLRDVDKTLLLEYTKGDNEDDVYGAALSLAICGYAEGFELLNQFADGSHRLSKNIHPIADIIPDLAFINDERAVRLEERIRRKFAK